MRKRLLLLLLLFWVDRSLAACGGLGIGNLQYSRDDLLLLRNMDYSAPNLEKWGELRRHRPNHDRRRDTSIRKRGRRGGVRQRLKRLTGTSKCPPLPSIVLANVRSLRNKLDELHANITCQWAYSQANLICLTETWLDNNIADSELSMDGFGTPLRLDRNTVSSLKSHGGGLCVYVNQEWSRTAVVKDSCCTPDLELLAVSFRPKYLPREFSQLSLLLVYIPPSGNVTRASETIAACVHKIECASPDSPVLILGDFNACRLNKILPTYQQYVKCTTRGEKTIDLCYGNVKNAYKACKKPPLSTADHNVVHLIPAYRTKLQREGVLKKQVEKWDDDAVIETLQACYECTDWEVLMQDNSLEEAADVVTDYIHFCEAMIVPTKTVKVFSNNKPWITKALKSTLNEKKIAFFSGNKIESKLIQNKLNKQLKAAKREYKDRVEKLFLEGKKP